MKSLLLIFLTLLFTYSSFSQGCVAIRGFSSCMSNVGNTANLQQGEFQISTNSRYFESFRHFRGDHEEANRVADGTQVINNTYLGDLSFNYGITNRIFSSIVLPYANNARSSMYEHGGNPPNGLGERHSTFSSGLSDIRLGVGYWIFDPMVSVKNNYSISLGVKLPTGDYNYKDNFYNQGTNKDQTIEAVVDQSIQPGDGGYGITLDLNGFNYINDSFILTSNFSYLINPQATNGILTRNGRSEFSCPDQFGLRVGTFYINPKLKNFALYFGARSEGVNATDLIGSSEGYRRPGYAISLEPGINYTYNNLNFNFNLPIAIYRNRIQSFEDKQRTSETGVFTQGDAAFADYLISFSISYRFGGGMPHHLE